MAESNGFYYMRARYYDPAVKRFISEDPLGFDGGDLNLYAYVGNNPVMGVDPLGLCKEPWHNVFATREGLVGGTTATGHVIQENDVFVALPSRKALNKNVELEYKGNTLIVPVKDVGPWNTKDPYWLTNSGHKLNQVQICMGEKQMVPE
jgi:RHS repeat-associated protein